MCSRYRLVKEKIVITINGREVEVTVSKRYNVAPQQTMPALVPDLPGIRAAEMKWGWQPVWSKQLLINAQAETVQEKSTFKKYLHQRCLVPADGFYEWTRDKSPIMFTKPDEAPFCFAGLWLEAAPTPEEAGTEPTHRFVVLTTTPNEAVGKVHNRMPFIVRPDDYGSWLADESFQAVLNSPDKSELNSAPVQRELNNVRNESPELIRPALKQSEFL